jgi:hypothetical protein
MRRIFVPIQVAVAAVAVAAGLAFAGAAVAAPSSSSGPGTGTGTGTSAPTGAPSGPASGATPTDLDLPIGKPVYAGPPSSPTPTPPTPLPTPDPGDTDDPRDEPPPVIYGEEIDSENDTIFYVLDRSGSMDWDEQSYTDTDGQRRRGTRMVRAQVELCRSILGLARNFKFNIIAYDCGTVRWRPEMQAATEANKSAATAWVRALEADGATGTAPAVALALSDRQNMCVVLLTDGEPNCGVWEFSGDGWLDDSLITEAHRRVIRESNTQHATINVFGIAASGMYRRFCVNVAADSGGSYFDIP